MSGVFRNTDPPPPHRPASVYPPLLVRGEDTLAGWRGGGGVNNSEGASHFSVLYICKYFVVKRIGEHHSKIASRKVGKMSFLTGLAPFVSYFSIGLTC
jgi:hypothetical protein